MMDTLKRCQIGYVVKEVQGKEVGLFVLLAKLWPFSPVNIVSAHTAKCSKNTEPCFNTRKTSYVWNKGDVTLFKTTVDIAEVVQCCKRAVSKR